MGDITTNFDRSEFACKCGCGLDDIDVDMVGVLQELRDHLTVLYGGNTRIRVNSACRCKEHNDAVGSNDRSQHRKLRAADITCTTAKPEEVYGILDEWYPDSCGIGMYDTFVHFDTRPERARW